MKKLIMLLVSVAAFAIAAEGKVSLPGTWKSAGDIVFIEEAKIFMPSIIFRADNTVRQPNQSIELKRNGEGQWLGQLEFGEEQSAAIQNLEITIEEVSEHTVQITYYIYFRDETYLMVSSPFTRLNSQPLGFLQF